MSSIITAILSSTVGLLCDKARDSAADKLRDGDLADEKMREMIVMDLSDIKSKIDCLSLKDLDASYSFLKGVELFNLALDQSNEDLKADEATRVINCTASGILNAALSLPQLIQVLKISSNKRFSSAQDCFKASRETATHAFNNKSLNIKDRIMACKLRVAARILELGLEDPEAAITACLVSLKELHGLPAIQEMFAVFLRGRWKSKIRKSERLENMFSVLFINHALYDFISMYSSKSRYLFAFPEIELKARLFHPILNACEVLTKTSTSGESFQQLKQVDIGSSVGFVDSFAVNSRGDIILLLHDKITVLYSRSENDDVMFPDNNMCGQWGSVAVDSDDNVYAIRRRKVRDKNGDIKYEFVLYAFDEIYNIKNVRVFDFLHTINMLTRVNIAVDKNQNLIMLTSWNNQVYVCDNSGKLKFQFQRNGDCLRSLSISNNNDIMIVSDCHSAIHTYSTDGDLKSTMKVTDGHEAWHVAFHYGICKIIVLSYAEKEDSYFLINYSKTGELENSVFFCTRNPEVFFFDIEMKSHPGGPVVVRYGKRISLIYEYELFNFCADNRFS